MKRDFVEISDDEWDNHSFQPSRVLNIKSPPPPPIESFAYGSSSSSSWKANNSSSSNRVQPVSETLVEEDNLEDYVDQVRPAVKRGRRFVVDDDDDDDEEEEEEGGGGDLAEVVEVKSSESEDLEFEFNDDDDDEAEEEEEEEFVKGRGEEGDVVGKALQKCAKISAMLKRELYGSSAAACDRYAETDVASIRVVTQDDVEAACGARDSDVQLILKPYQLVGVNFLLLLHKKEIGGVILADEMGLGKTIQALTYLSLLKHLHNESGPHLVVCPASVLENWERELKRWCPSFTVLQFHGAARASNSKKLSHLGKAGKRLPFDVILVCYSLFERRSEQQKDERKILKRFRWSCVLMDEAHALKDRNSYRWKNLMSVARNARQRLMLTGTPLQNDLHELWSLLEFMMPDLFATREDVDLKKLLNAEDSDLVSRMKSILGPFILRRLKSDVMQQLVPKIQQVEYVCMDTHQDDAYKEAIEEYRAAARARVSKSSAVKLTNVYGVLPQRQISNYFVQFRKIANHPLLVRRIFNDADVHRFANKLYPMGVFGFECNLDRVIQELKSYNDFTIHRLLLYHGIADKKGTLPDDHVFVSAKCQALSKLLPSLKKGGHRVLIFSQWTSMMDILEWTLDVLRLKYRRLDGSTQVNERQTIVDTFNTDTSIFACLLSTRAGGQGLNLTGADTVIIHDMDFNPQIDRQAEDRCHRIGQTKPVTIYRLVTKGTVDENVYEIAKRKLVLDAAVLEAGTEVNDKSEVPERTMGEILSALLLG